MQAARDDFGEHSSPKDLSPDETEVKLDSSPLHSDNLHLKVSLLILKLHVIIYNVML
jgi:hypothetical protein